MNKIKIGKIIVIRTCEKSGYIKVAREIGDRFFEVGIFKERNHEGAGSESEWNVNWSGLGTSGVEMTQAYGEMIIEAGKIAGTLNSK